MLSDLEKLQGAWIVRTLQHDGRRVPPSEFVDARIVVDGDRFTSFGMGVPYGGTLTIDDTARPKTLDMLFTTGHAAGVRHAGVYKLSDDAWTFCLAMRGTARPTRFAAAPGSGFALERLTRSKTPVTAAPRARARRRATRRPDQRATRTTGPADAGNHALDGTWQMVAGVFSGVPMSDEMLKWCTRITADGVTTVMAGPQTMLEAAFMTDAARSPHQIDYDNLAGSNARRKQAGIFRLVSDVLEICMAPPGQARPSEFASVKGDGRSCTTWRRGQGSVPGLTPV
ncbi:MAG: TIGR03067 domain-containing protein [Vicinamibacterales bacterium]